MDPVLDQVGQEHDRNELDHEGQGGHPALQLAQDGGRSHPLGRGEAHEGEDLHHETAHEVIEDVLPPFIPEKGLLGLERAEALERNEDDSGEQDVQGEPIEPEEQGGRVRGQGAGGGPAQQGRKQGGGDAKRTEELRRTQRQAQRRRGETEQEDREDPRLEPGLGMQGRELGHRELPRGAHRDHQGQPDQAERRGRRHR